MIMNGILCGWWGAVGMGFVLGEDSNASGLLPPEGAPLILVPQLRGGRWAVGAAADGGPGSRCGVLLHRWRWQAALM